MAASRSNSREESLSEEKKGGDKKRSEKVKKASRSRSASKSEKKRTKEQKRKRSASKRKSKGKKDRDKSRKRRERRSSSSKSSSRSKARKRSRSTKKRSRSRRGRSRKGRSSSRKKRSRSRKRSRSAKKSRSRSRSRKRSASRKKNASPPKARVKKGWDDAGATGVGGVASAVSASALGVGLNGSTASPTDMSEAIKAAQLKAAEHLRNNTPPPPADMRPGDWFCPNCTIHNYRTRPRCFRCHTAKPGLVLSNGNAGAPPANMTQPQMLGNIQPNMMRPPQFPMGVPMGGAPPMCVFPMSGSHMGGVPPMGMANMGPMAMGMPNAIAGNMPNGMFNGMPNMGAPAMAPMGFANNQHMPMPMGSMQNPSIIGNPMPPGNTSMGDSGVL